MRRHVPRFADERYAEQRQQGFAVLKFEPDLETEYRNSYIALNANRLRLAHTVGIAAALSFVFLDLATFQMLPGFSHVVLLSVTIPALAAPVAATWLNGAGETVQRYTFYCSLVLCVSIVVVVELGRAARPLFPYEVLLLVVLYVYLVVANVIGMIGNYILQYDSRKAFLLQSELWLRAVQDPLTGALNRREFCNRLDIAWAVAQREKVPLGLMLVDLDQFKQVNDSYGHPAGDLALRRVAETLLACALRPQDAIDLADCKLYQCKRAGGGTIATGVLAPPASPV